MSQLLHKQTQEQCCYRSSLSDDAAYCGTCSKPLIRCMAAQECGGLLDDHGLCTVCVNPVIQVEAGAVATARVGDAIALPLSITNASSIGRPLFVTGLWSREGGVGEWHRDPLGWERLSRGDTRAAKIMARDIQQTGSHSIELRIAVSNHWLWRKECYVFHTDFTLTVAPAEKNTGHVVNVDGKNEGHGSNIVYISGSGEKDYARQVTGEPIFLKLDRLELVERELDYRGTQNGTYVPRNAVIGWQGFPQSDISPEGPITTLDGILIAGRNRSKLSGGQTDLRLMAETREGLIDNELSLSISRRHFELYIECDRLMLRVASDNGVRINNQTYSRNESVALQDGDLITPLVRRPENFGIRVVFHTDHKRVRRIIFTRTPESLRGS